MPSLLTIGSRLSVRTRLTAWFVAIAVATAGVGMVAVSTVSNDIEALNEDADSLYAISLVRTNYTQMRMELMVSILAVLGQDQGAGFLLDGALDRLAVADTQVDENLAQWQASTSLDADRVDEVEAAIAHHREIVRNVALPLVEGRTPTLDPPAGRSSWDIGSTLDESNDRFRALAELLTDVANEEHLHFEADAQAAADRASQTRSLVYGGGAAGVVVAAVIGSRIARRFALSLKAMITALDQVRTRDYTARVPVVGSDEFARVGQGLNETVETLQHQADELRETTDELHEASMALRQVSDGLSHQTSTVSERAQDVTGSLSMMSHQTSSVRTAIEQMNESIREIASRAAEATTTSRAGTEEARDAAASVRSLEESMRSIETSVGAIGRIAAQTTMLALNATIEAARAGEAGRGFAVVAGEVQDLARAASVAAADIEHSVSDVRVGVDAAVSSMARVEQLIIDVDSAQTVIAAAVEEQTATVNEMAQAVVTVADSVTEVEVAMSSVSASAEDARQGTDLTRERATRLAVLAERLRSV